MPVIAGRYRRPHQVTISLTILKNVATHLKKWQDILVSLAISLIKQFKS